MSVHQNTATYSASNKIATLAPCPTCGHRRGSVVMMPQWCVHHAALRCGGSNRFLRWLPKPENAHRRRLRKAIAQKIASGGRDAK